MIICPKCKLQPIPPFGKWEVFSCLYCGHPITKERQAGNKPSNKPSVGRET